MAAGRKPGSNSGRSAGGAPAVDPHAPTQTSLRADDPAREPRKPASGAFTPDAPTKIMPPTPSLEEDRGSDGADVQRGEYRQDARTQAMNLGGLLEEDPFAPRATDAEMPSFSSDEAEGPPLLDLDEGARVDLRAPGALPPAPPPGQHDLDDDADDVVEISLSDMEALPELADDDSEEDTHDTVVNLPLPPSLQRDAAADPKAPGAPRGVAATSSKRDKPAKPPLPIATVVERRSHSPAALFDEDTASVTDPRREQAPSPVSIPQEPPVVASDAAAGSLASERTAARPSLVSQPSGDPPAPRGGDPSAVEAGAAASPVPEEEEYWEDESIAEADAEVADETIAPDLSDVSHDEPPPLLHKWKVVPTVIKEMEAGAPAPAAAAFGGGDLAKKLQTVLWSPDDEAAARAEHAAAARARNPFWAPTDVGVDVDEDEDALESTEAAAPSDPFHAAAAYVHDALAYLRSLSHFSAHLDDDVRLNFDDRMLGATEKLRRALTVLQSGADEAAGDEGRRRSDAPGAARANGLAPDASVDDDEG